MTIVTLNFYMGLLKALRLFRIRLLLLRNSFEETNLIPRQVDVCHLTQETPHAHACSPIAGKYCESMACTRPLGLLVDKWEECSVLFPAAKQAKGMDRG